MHAVLISRFYLHKTWKISGTHVLAVLLLPLHI